MEVHHINSERLTLKDIYRITGSRTPLVLSDSSRIEVMKSRQYLDNVAKDDSRVIYGVNTGFGALYDKAISREDLTTLQENLVKSHACGMGNEISCDIVRLMLLLKAQSLSYGKSGVHPDTIDRLILFYNEDVLPVIYEMGSLGASGDLAPLAHLSLPLIGEGEVVFKGVRMPSKAMLDKLGLEPLTLHSKAGLALLNGTQFMSSYGVYSILKSYRLSRLADIIGAMSLDAFDGRIEPFHPRIQEIRPHKGQLTTAARIIRLLGESELINRKKSHVQDPYSFRCIPQVHGASKDFIEHAAGVIETEVNSVTDNPTIFPEEDLVISAGNFHGQPLALAMDMLAIAIAELGNISERRTFQLIHGKRGLPPFLVNTPGLNSGFMIPQYTAASLVSLNKQLCTPSSVDSIETSQGQEDHVSMGANAATKALRVVENVERVLAIELFNAAQAMDFRKPVKSSDYIEDVIAQYRERVGFIEQDKIMYDDMNASVDFIREMALNLPGETEAQGV